MPKVSIITLPFRKTHLIAPVFDAIFAQTHTDLEVIVVLNDPKDGSRQILEKNYPRVRIIDNDINSFAKGVNIGIKNSSGDFIQMVNDDLILEPNYIEEILKVFSNPKVASATGKILRYDFSSNQKLKIIDTAGLVFNPTGRVRDIGQLQEDMG